MPIFSIKEFAALTNKKPKDIHTYAGRGKIIKNEHKQIDTTNPINLAFYEANHINGEKPKINGTTKTKNGKEVKTIKVSDPTEHSLVIQEKAKVELEAKKLDLENKKLENRKKRGELVSLEDTANTVKAYSDGLKRELDQNIQILIQDICARHGIESGKAGEYKQKVSELINKSNKTAIELLLKNIGHEKI